MAELTASKILVGFDKARSDKAPVENAWEDYMHMVVPRKRGIQSTLAPGEKAPEDVFDDTAIQSNLILAAGLSGYMTNAAQRWFELRPRDESLMTQPEVAQFFSVSQEKMYSVLGNSNFYQQIHEAYIDLGGVGNACMYEDDDFKDVVRFYTRHPREVYIVEDDREEVTLVYRSFPMTAWQAYLFFGEKECGQAVLKAVEEDHDYNKQFQFIHHVRIRNKRDPRKIDGKNKPFASYWVSVADKKTIREGGYEEFPYFCPRFYKNSGEVYGYGPSYACYPSIKRLNNATEMYEDAAKQDTYPPWLAEHDGMMGTLDLRKDAINYQKQPLSNGQAIQSLKHDRNVQIGIDYMERQALKVRAAFFVDLFLMMTNGGNMTATEVIQRSQEKMLILGPVLGRLQNELLNPVIYRTFNIMLRRGILPPVPQALQGKEWDVVYVSPLAKAQRAVQANDMQTFLMVMQQMSAYAPQVIDKLNVDKITDKFSKVYSVDPDIINDDDAVKTIRNNRTAQQEQQNKLQMMMAGAKIAGDIGGASRSFAQAKEKN